MINIDKLINCGLQPTSIESAQNYLETKKLVCT